MLITIDVMITLSSVIIICTITHEYALFWIKEYIQFQNLDFFAENLLQYKVFYLQTQYPTKVTTILTLHKPVKQKVNNVMRWDDAYNPESIYPLSYTIDTLLLHVSVSEKWWYLN